MINNKLLSIFHKPSIALGTEEPEQIASYQLQGTHKLVGKKEEKERTEAQGTELKAQGTTQQESRNFASVHPVSLFLEPST